MNAAHALASAPSVLAEVFHEARRRARVSGTPVLASVSFQVAAVDPIDVFAAWHDNRTPCTYWESQSPAQAMFGWDCALELRADDERRFADIDRAWRALQSTAVVDGPLGPRLLGGFGFDPQRPRESHWSEYPLASMSLAKLLLVRTPQDCHVICQHLLGADDDPSALADRYGDWVESLHQPPLYAETASSLLDTQALPAGEWQAKVERAVAEIRNRRMAKVVLARQVRQTYDQSLSPAALLRRLRRASFNAHVFAMARGDSCFLGATPERLVRVHDGLAQTHALAGSTRRSDNPDVDETLGQALLDDGKERHEHALVVDAIRDVLSPRAQSLSVPAAPILCRLPRIQHLSTPIQARLRNGIGVLELVDALHPTPAVAGHDRDTALAYIRANEGFDRGWYAAPLGWIDAQGNGDFVVALRSALVRGHDCYLFAGCGIVGDSDPACEYRETCLKLSNIQDALAGGPRV